MIFSGTSRLPDPCFGMTILRSLAFSPLERLLGSNTLGASSSLDEGGGGGDKGRLTPWLGGVIGTLLAGELEWSALVPVR